MYPKSRNDLTWTCCGEDVEEKTKGLAVKNPVLLRVTVDQKVLNDRRWLPI